MHFPKRGAMRYTSLGCLASRTCGSICFAWRRTMRRTPDASFGSRCTSPTGAELLIAALNGLGLHHGIAGIKELSGA